LPQQQHSSQAQASEQLHGLPGGQQSGHEHSRFFCVPANASPPTRASGTAASACHNQFLRSMDNLLRKKN
jgi:hypothetical protein